jgi:hypothetical protein
MVHVAPRCGKPVLFRPISSDRPQRGVNFESGPPPESVLRGMTDWLLRGFSQAQTLSTSSQLGRGVPVDVNGDAVADIAYRMRFSSSADGGTDRDAAPR